MFGWHPDTYSPAQDTIGMLPGWCLVVVLGVYACQAIFSSSDAQNQTSRSTSSATRVAFLVVVGAPACSTSSAAIALFLLRLCTEHHHLLARLSLLPPLSASAAASSLNSRCHLLALPPEEQG